MSSLATSVSIDDTTYLIKRYGKSIELNEKNNFHQLLQTKADDSKDFSPWPMFGHDTKHISRSPYSTAGNPLELKWVFRTSSEVASSPVVDENGTIYFTDLTSLYALNPNGTFKWRHKNAGIDSASPAIDKDGIIYYGTQNDNYFYAVYPNGTTKWVFVPNHGVNAPPTIGEDGTIYFGTFNEYGRFYALNRDGTEKWHYDADFFCAQSPVIGDDGIIYFASYYSLYAFYPNGTLFWKLPFSGGWNFLSTPSIGLDGTIYIALDHPPCLYGVNPDGTIKWQCIVDEGCDKTMAAPSIDEDGTIYFAFKHLYAIYPNGAKKWEFTPNVGDDPFIVSEANAISADGTIYFVTTDYGYIYLFALNQNGEEIQRLEFSYYAVYSGPVIAPDGTIYFGSWDNDDRGSLSAFGKLDPNAPQAPTINGPKKSKHGVPNEYNFTSTSPLGKDIYYYIEWGDGSQEEWIGPYPSGITITVSHSWEGRGTYVIGARAKDIDNICSSRAELKVTMPYSYGLPFKQFWNDFFDRFPHAFPLLRYLLRQ